MHNAGLPAIFGFGGGADAKNSSMVIVNAGQGGLTLPNRDYYTKEDDKSVETRKQFMIYLTNMFGHISEKNAAAKAKVVMDIQTRLANASLQQVELRNPDNRYNKISVKEAQEITPNLSWTEYMNTRGVPAVSEFNIGQAAFFKEVNAMIGEVSMENWKTYLKFMAVNAAASSLPKKIADENFAFFGKYLSGAKERQPRWKTCVRSTDGNLGEALGEEYIKKAFKPEARMHE